MYLVSIEHIFVSDNRYNRDNQGYQGKTFHQGNIFFNNFEEISNVQCSYYAALVCHLTEMSLSLATEIVCKCDMYSMKLVIPLYFIS